MKNLIILLLFSFVIVSCTSVDDEKTIETVEQKPLPTNEINEELTPEEIELIESLLDETE